MGDFKIPVPRPECDDYTSFFPQIYGFKNCYSESGKTFCNNHEKIGGEHNEKRIKYAESFWGEIDLCGAETGNWKSSRGICAHPNGTIRNNVQAYERSKHFV